MSNPSDDLVIDAFTHVLPERVFQQMSRLHSGFGSMAGRIERMPMLRNLDDRFRAMDEWGNYKQFITLSSPPLEEIAKGAEATELAEIANDEMASLVHLHPDRFIGFAASVSLDDVGSALMELDRAARQLDAGGVQLFTDAGGLPLDDPRFDPIIERAWRLGLPIWLHPSRTPAIPDYTQHQESEFDMWQTFGWPYATSVAMVRLVLRGVFDRFPGVKIITHHLGGMIPYHYVRAERGLLREARAPRPEAGIRPFSRPPIQYLKQFYADTAMHGAVDAVECGLKFFGASRVLFATDHPFGSIQSGFELLDGLQLDQRQQLRIQSGNLMRLIRKKTMVEQMTPAY